MSTEKSDSDVLTAIVADRNRLLQGEIDRILRFALASDDEKSRQWAFGKIDSIYNMLFFPEHYNPQEPRFPNRDF